jgi:hypothetical protein
MVRNLLMSIMQLRWTFASGGRRLFEMKFTKFNEKSFIKTVYQNNITICYQAV